MNRNALLSIVLLTALIALPGFSIYAQQRDRIYSNTDETNILSLVNRERARYGLSQLYWNERLADLARKYSGTMARERFFEHIDKNGDSVVERAQHERIRGWNKIGENLFMCSPTYDLPTVSVRGWMRSPTHRENILDPEWQTTGIGIAYARDGRTYITQVFAD